MDTVTGRCKPNKREKLTSWLREFGIRVEEELTVGLPEDSFRSDSASTERVFWIPADLPAGTAFHIASSRLGRQPESKPIWFDAFRTICSRLQHQRHFLVTAPGTTSHPYVLRAGQLFHLSVVIFQPFPKNPTENWFVNTRRKLAGSKLPNKVVFYSQPLTRGCETGVDSLLISVARETRLLSVRQGGKVMQATINRLRDDSPSQPRPWLLIDSQLTPESVQEELIAAGACPWWLYDDDASAQPIAISRPNDPKIVPIESINLNQYLLHWTRRNSGPWPGETQTKYVDDLIVNSPSAKHDRLSALCRILATSKLFASNQLTRDKTPVVCFSAVTVDQLPDLRTFRSHINRWDFETIGIAIRKTVVEQLGGRPVVYGDEKTWNSLPLAERPFFQVGQTSSKVCTIDWTREQEWRVKGDVNLRILKPDDAFLFVSSIAEAQAVLSLSRWPVVNLFS